MTTVTEPQWTRQARDWRIRFTDTDGREQLWHARYDNYEGHRSRAAFAWHAWPDIPDPDRWDKPVELARTQTRAKEEFLLRIVHGWQIPYGYVDGDSKRPVYGRDGTRRERAHILAELLGRGVCGHCRRLPHLYPDGTLRPHHQPRATDRCDGSGGVPETEPQLEPWGADASGAVTMTAVLSSVTDPGDVNVTATTSDGLPFTDTITFVDPNAGVPASITVTDAAAPTA